MKLHFFLPLLIFITVLLEMSQYLHLKKNELINDKSINIHKMKTKISHQNF